MSISEVAQRLENIYTEDGPATKAQSSLEDAGTSITGARDALSEVGKDSEQPELPDSVAALGKAVEAIDEARKLLAGAVGGIAIIRSRVLGEDGGSGGITTFTPGQTVSQSFQSKEPPKPRVQVMHLTANGIHLKSHPRPEVQTEVEQTVLEQLGMEELFRTYVDNTPNLNGEYSEEIDFVRQYFADQGVDLPPIVTLDDERFEHAAQLRGMGDMSKADGYVTAGRIIMRTVPAGLAKEIFGSHLYLGKLIHEAGHFEGHNHSNHLIASVQEGDNITTMANLTDSGFTKNVISNRGGLKIATEGQFLEEGIADLRRVEVLRAAGQEADIDGSSDLGGGLIVRGSKEEVALPSVYGLKLEMPARFTTAAKTLPDGRHAISSAPPMFASYAMELIANEVPSFREAVAQSRHNPAMQAEVIKGINSLQPGLYRTLRKLPYTYEGFEQGLRLIGHAIRDNRSWTIED